MYKKISAKVVVAIIAVCMLITISIVFFTSSKCGYSPGFRNPDLLPFNPEISKLEGCYFEWQCQYIDNSLARNQCYTHIANKKNDKKVCEKIDSESFKNACIQTIDTE